jgi:ribosomal protein S18 acetylase RimI-like enzyme
VSRLDTRSWTDERLRVSRWRSDPLVGYLAPQADVAVSAPAVRRCVARLAGQGVVEVVTAALTPGEQAGFLAAGFTVRERLHLLAKDLAGAPEPPDVATTARLRRGHRTDRRSVLAVDHLAFPPFWQLDGNGLQEAMAATPASRLRVAVDPAVVGYAVTGRAGGRGYLQRLAVHPGHQGHGVGTALVVDALRWMRRHGADRAIVNTQERNDAALRLYLRLGFRLQPGGLAVLWSVLDPSAERRLPPP